MNQPGRLNPYYLFTGALVFLAVSAYLVIGVTFPNLNILEIYLIAVNAAAFILIGYDKSIAGSNEIRVPEKILLGSALVAGSLGVLLGIKIFRHKIRQPRFQFYLVGILIIQAIRIWSTSWSTGFSL